MKKRKSAQEGVLTLEVCLCLTLLMFLILFLYSFFAIFEAQTKVQHTLIQTAQSMSLDGIASYQIDDAKSIFDIANVIGFNVENKNPQFASDNSWSKDKNQVAEIAKQRFVAYLSSGDEKAADDFLKGCRVTDGLEGLDFSKCNMDSDGNINLSVSYTVEYMFDFKGFNMKPLHITSKTTSKLWSKK